jgi:hypothetical protein
MGTKFGEQICWEPGDWDSKSVHSKTSFPKQSLKQGRAGGKVIEACLLSSGPEPEIGSWQCHATLLAPDSWTKCCELSHGAIFLGLAQGSWPAKRTIGLSFEFWQII